MPDWMNSAFEIFQLLINAGALIVGAFIWKLYIASLKSSIDSKSAAIENVEKSRDYWKEKALDLERRSPEFMEAVLADRIKTREEEVRRLSEDVDSNKEILRSLEEEKLVLKRDLDRTSGFRRMLQLNGELDSSDIRTSDPDESIEVSLLGLVAVDSGQLMVTDPCYVDTEWLDEQFVDIRKYVDPKTGDTWQFGVDFRTYQDVLPSLGRSVNDLLEAGLLIEVERQVPASFDYSYDGACQATLNKGHGELNFGKGHAGAAVAFETAFGDGMYPVYGERHDGRMTRVYVNVG